MKANMTNLILASACAIALAVPLTASARSPGNRSGQRPPEHYSGSFQNRSSSGRRHQSTHCSAPSRGHGYGYSRPAPTVYYYPACPPPAPVYYFPAYPPPPPVITYPVHYVRPGVHVVFSL